MLPAMVRMRPTRKTSCADIEAAPKSIWERDATVVPGDPAQANKSGEFFR
jgi:hypothetical protein